MPNLEWTGKEKIPKDKVIEVEGSDWPIKILHLRNGDVVLQRGPHKIEIPHVNLGNVANSIWDSDGGT